MKRERLDRVLVDRGIVDTRTKAQSYIRRGYIRVNGRVITKPGMPVPPGGVVDWARIPDPYVSRGARKLAPALEAFRLEVMGRRCLDIGASTGGFTQVLLEGGADRVYAVDVGYGQLVSLLRDDPRVIVLERTNARYLDRGVLSDPIDFVTIDVSFISVTRILPSLTRLAFQGPAVVLVKPQFELEKRYVGKGGIVRSVRLQRSAVESVTRFARGIGFICSGTLPAAVRGTKGNQEYFLHLHWPGSERSADSIMDVER